MNPEASGLGVRARGLRRRLIAAADLASLSELDSPEALAEALGSRRVPRADPPGRNASEALELGFRQRATELLAILERWRGRGRDALALLEAEEERRSLRALLRGAVAGTAPELRRAGLIPTRELPLRRLDELARAAEPLAVASRLESWGWSDAEPLSAVAAATRPDLATFERLLRARFARRVQAAASTGDRELQRECASTIDCENALAAVALASGEGPPAEDDFLAGGRRLARADFARAACAASAGEALLCLARSSSEREIARALRASFTTPSRLGERLVGARLRAAAAAVRLQPLGTPPLVELSLALRAEGQALRRMIWGFALGAPAFERRGEAA